MKSILFVVCLVVIGFVVASSLLHTENRKENDAMNALMVIVPYKYEGLWVFDDAALGLSREPFIAGIDTLLIKPLRTFRTRSTAFAQSLAARDFRARIL